MTVGPLPGITGTTSVCPGSVTHLSDATSGGVWSGDSDNTVATVSGTGIVSGVASGTANISYTVGSCSAGIAVTVTALAPITGTTTLCGGSITTLSDATAGGVWSSSNTSVATVSGTGVVTGVTTGTTNISYTLGSCYMTLVVTVSGTLSSITGTTAICTGATTHLSDATSGGVWSSDNTAIATVSGTGIVYGISRGTANISPTQQDLALVGIAVTVTALLRNYRSYKHVCWRITIIKRCYSGWRMECQ